MAEVLETDITVAETRSKVDPKSSYGLLSFEFMKRHGAHFLGTATIWFLLDIAFYSLQLTQNDVYPAGGLLQKASVNSDPCKN